MFLVGCRADCAEYLVYWSKNYSFWRPFPYMISGGIKWSFKECTQGKSRQLRRYPFQSWASVGNEQHPSSRTAILKNIWYLFGCRWPQGEGGTVYNGLYGEAAPERGTFILLYTIFDRKGNLNDGFPNPVLYFGSWNPYPFIYYILLSRKRYPFLAEPTHITLEKCKDHLYKQQRSEAGSLCRSGSAMLNKTLNGTFIAHIVHYRAYPTCPRPSFDHFSFLICTFRTGFIRIEGFQNQDRARDQIQNKEIRQKPPRTRNKELTFELNSLNKRWLTTGL